MPHGHGAWETHGFLSLPKEVEYMQRLKELGVLRRNTTRTRTTVDTRSILRARLIMSVLDSN